MERFVTSDSPIHTWNGNDWLRMSNAESNRIARESLKIAMMQLLSDRTLDDISISDLVHRAGISRSAFYRNYASKDALIADICQQILQEIMDILRAPLHRENRPKWFAELFRSIQKNVVYFKVYLDTHMELTKSSILETVCPSDGIEDHYQLVAREGAFFHVLTDWFRRGMNETQEYMGKLFDQLIPHGKLGQKRP